VSFSELHAKMLCHRLPDELGNQTIASFGTIENDLAYAIHNAGLKFLAHLGILEICVVK